LIFEGEFFDGKKNGKGKEYYENENHLIKYQGEYLNGERNGEGKEYNDKGDLIFEGEYLNGKIWNGKGQENEIKNVSNFEIKYSGDEIVIRKG
jgi:antitoxin component YwqK of YwqJK toxin-antitoxin module